MAADSAGDLNYADNSCTGVGNCSNGAAPGSVNLANWHLAVSGAGASDGTPLVITVTSSGTSWSNQALLAISVDGGGTTALTFNGTGFNFGSPGVVGSKLALGGPFTQVSPLSFQTTVSTTDNTIQGGLYPAQVIVPLTVRQP